MGLISAATKYFLAKRYSKIEYFCRHPQRVQAEIFQKLIVQGGRTQWGKQHGLHKIRHYEQFNARVPISSYEDLQPYIKRMMAGERNVLWPESVNWFAKSSGTTASRSKYIPVPHASLYGNHYKAGMDLIALYLHNRPDSKVLNGKNLVIGGTLYNNDENAKLRNGDVSALIMYNLPWWAQRMRTPSLDIALLPNFEEKIEKIARLTINQDITCISGVPTWMVVVMQRAMELKGASHAHEIWPNLEVFLHGAVAFGPYRQLFNKLLPGEHMSYMETYNASEGFFGIQDDLSLQDQMLLMLDYGIFYEFLPLSELGKPKPQAIPLSEVQMETQYALVITSNGGLWRYLIGDTVKFTSTNPYRIKITGRTRHFINAFGEELIVENAEAGIQAACKKTGAIIKEFTAAPVYMDGTKRGGHEWVLEFDKAPQSLDDFMQALDEALREVNSDYDAKRYKDMALVAPIGHLAPAGTFNNWMKQRGKLGGQHKVPRLSNERDHLDELIPMLQEV